MGLCVSRPTREDIDLEKRVKDHMKAFLDAYCIVDKAASVRIMLLYAAWMQYARIHGFIKDLDKYKPHRTYMTLLKFPEGVSVDVCSGDYKGIALYAYPLE
jgi:hypothetical protein